MDWPMNIGHRPRPANPTTKRRHVVLERRKAVAALLVGGVTHCRAIAERLGVSKSTAANDLN